MTLTQARSRIQDLRRRIGAPISVEIALYRESGSAVPGVAWLATEDAEKRMQKFRRGDRSGLILQDQARVRPGDRVYLGERRSRVYLSHYSAQYTAKTKGVDPRRTLLQYGNGVSLIFEASPDGLGLAMHFEITLLDAPDKVDPIEVSTEDIESMERVAHSEDRLIGSLSMPNEAAFVYAPGGSTDASLRALVLVHRKVPPPPVETGVLLLPNTLLAGKISFNHAPNLGADSWLPEPLSQGQVAKMLLDSAAGDKEGKLTLPFFNERYLILEAKPAVLPRALARLGALSAARSRNFVVRLGREAWLDGKWVEQGTPLALPVMAHRSTAMVDGKSRSYLQSYSPEEEGMMRILTPQLGWLFAGSVAQVSVIPTGSKLTVHLELQRVDLLGLRRIERTGPDKGLIEAPRQNRLVRSLQLQLEPGKKHILGSGLGVEIAGKKIQTRLWIQVQALEGGR